MSWLDDNIDDIMFDEYMHRNSVEDFIEDMTDQELMKETGEVLRSSLPKWASEPDVTKARSILQKGIIYQRLTERQRYALGDFILIYQ